VAPMEGVQNLEEDQGRFAFELDECRHNFLFNAFKSELCVVEIVTDFSAELLYCIVILDVLARDERSTNFKNAEMRFGAVALSAASKASVAISMLSARYVSTETLLFFERGEQRSNSRKSFEVPVMVDLGKVFASVAKPRLDNSLLTGSVGTGSR
jgi:hypothetical protein